MAGPLSEKEAKTYYAGLPSRPVLVARTGAPWEAPTGPEAYMVLKELCPVGYHPLVEVWEDNLALKLHTLLDSMEVMWTSTDVVRIRVAERWSSARECLAPVILWIGVMPGSLSRDDGLDVASKCQELLREYDITDVDVEFRESVVARSAGPKLLTSPLDFDPIPDIREPLTTALGLPICAHSERWAEGTGGFFITEGENTERLLLVTARHVVFTPNEDDNQFFEYKNDSQSRYNVTLFGDAAFNKYIKSIQDEIEHNDFTAQYHEDRIRTLEGNNNPEANEKRSHAQAQVKAAREGMKELNIFYKDVLTRWATPDSRVLGHVILSPPISVGSEGYTEDWAVIEIDASKVDTSNFKGNAIDLGTRIPEGEFTLMMTPNWRDAPDDSESFRYPIFRLLELRGTTPDGVMRRPTARDQYGDPCLMVMKRGSTTGLTVGRANQIFSYVRNYYNDDSDTPETSKEWGILPFDSKSGAFSEEGDSGSVIVDGPGRIGGLLTSGAGATPDFDISYATPISFLLNRMKANGLHEPNINPVLAS